jgi:hypothetical protein
MLLGRCRAWCIVPVSFLLIGGSGVLAQTNRAWVDPPGDVSRSSHAPQHEPQASVQPGPGVPSRPWTKPKPEAEAAQPEPIDPVSSTSSIGSARTSDMVTSKSRKSAGSAQPHRASLRRAAQPVAPGPSPLPDRERAARDLAFRYLELWSGSNRMTLAGTRSFYGSSVVFHGRRMSFSSLLAEKRRFVQRWPSRDYRYRPETMGIACDSNGNLCRVHSSFEFTAAHAGRGRRSRGIGSHDLVVSFSEREPVIASESSQELRQSQAASGLFATLLRMTSTRAGPASIGGGRATCEHRDSGRDQ